MFITFNPRFQISRIPLPWNGNKQGDDSSWKWRKNDRMFFFSRGQWALAEAVRLLKRTEGSKRAAVFVPEYFCEISLTPLRILGAEIVFYRLNSNLEPDISDLDRLAGRGAIPEFLVFVHYFGVPVPITGTAAWCRQHGVILIEDAAHSLCRVPGIGDHGFPTFYTPWKFLNIPQAALLVLPESTSLRSPSPESGSTARGPGWQIPKWFLKQVVLATVEKTRFPAHKLRHVRVKQEDESELISDPGAPECPSFYEKVLRRAEPRIGLISQLRNRHFRLIDEKIRHSELHEHILIRDLPERFAPYVFPLKMGAGCRKVMIALNRIGIPAQPWSDLSPEVKNSERYPLANSLRRQVMVIPVHQDLDSRKIEWMTSQIMVAASVLGHN